MSNRKTLHCTVLFVAALLLISCPSPVQDSTKSITAFGFASPMAVGIIDETTHSIAIMIPHSTVVTALVPTITHTGVSISPASAVAQDFTNPVTYTVIAADASPQEYTVTVTTASNTAKAITAFSFASPAATGIITEATHTIAITVPYGTVVTALVPTITQTGVSISPASAVAQDFTNPITYTVTAADATTQAYTVTVTIASNTDKAITAFSFASPAATGIITEATHTIAITVPYGTVVTALVPTITQTGVSISPASAVAQDFTNPITYTVTAADATTQAYTVTVTIASNTDKAITAFSFASPAATGIITEADHTIAITVPYGTTVTTLVPTISHTGAGISPASAVAQDFTNPVTYTVTAADASPQEYTVTVTTALNPAKAITAFSFASPAATGIITEADHTIAITVPYGTTVTALVPTISHTGASISPASAVAQDFTNPVMYTVTAADASPQEYTVTVTIALNPAKAITAFSFASPAATGITTEATYSIAITIPHCRIVTALVPTIIHSGVSISPASAVAQNFTNPVTYTVTAADGTTQPYIVSISLAPAMVTTLAGSGAKGSANGVGTVASFNEPYGVAVDSTGNVYVADSINHLIRKISPAGIVTTLAGSGSIASNNGTGTAASFYGPKGVAVDSSGNVYVGDTGNSLIRKISPAGVVTTLAGSGVQGSVNGTGTGASFFFPIGVAVDSAGYVYVADKNNNKIRKISPAGVVTTLAGSGAYDKVNGTGIAASFNGPTGVTVDSSGNVYVADRVNYLIRKISPAGVVTTLAGSGVSGQTNATGIAASFGAPVGVAVDSTGNVYVADGSLIRKINPAGVVTTLAGSGASGEVNGTGDIASFASASGVTVDSLGNVYVGDLFNDLIRKIE